MLPKTSTYVKIYDGQTKWMYVLIEDDDILGKCNASWDKVSSKKICSKYVYNKNFLKTEIKSYNDEATDFHNKKYLSLALIILAKEQSI